MMLVKFHWLLLLIVVLLVGWLLVPLNSGIDFEDEFEKPFWLFNFAPENAPDFTHFKKVSAKTVYDPTAGYGWTNIEGKL